jgi:hypothetical protein
MLDSIRPTGVCEAPSAGETNGLVSFSRIDGRKAPINGLKFENGKDLRWGRPMKEDQKG